MRTYAQNFEDVMLQRLFYERTSGFYVDIGASHPHELSVTKHFYDRGWSGINIEPVPAKYNLLAAARPRDINLNLAAGKPAARLEFAEVTDNDALSTFDSDRALELEREGHQVRRYEVEVLELNEILERHARGRGIDFLKIDVEGREENVLQSIDLGRWRPKVMVIEAVTPTNNFSGWDSFDPFAGANWQAWEPLLITHGYAFAYFDGLNRFYVRAENAGLAQRLATPPGVFDNIMSDLVVLETNASLTTAGDAGVADHLPETTGAIAPTEAALATMRRQLEEKQQVIDRLSGGVDFYKGALRTFGAVDRALYPMLRRLKWLVKPRLGQLVQHPARAFRLPDDNLRAAPLVQTPTISIVTPSYEQAAFIARTIDSVLGQNYPALEYFVQDGGSRDGTVDVLGIYADKLSGWSSEPDSGQTQAINRGFAHTSGEIMGWLNSDDILLPGTLHRVARYFGQHPEVDVVYGHRIMVDENDKIIGRWMMPQHNDEVLSWVDYIPQETMFWRRRIWDRVGGCLDEAYSFAMDWDLVLRFREAGAKFVRIPFFMGGFRVHHRQKTSSVISGVGYAEMDRLRLRTLGRVPSWLETRKAVAPYLLGHLLTDLVWRLRNRPGGPL